MRRLGPGDFEGERIKNQGAIGVLFYAEWCPFSREFKPRFMAMPEEGYELALADISEYRNPLWKDFNIRVVPTIIVFKDGKESWRKNGTPFVGLGDGDLEHMLAALKS